MSNKQPSETTDNLSIGASNKSIIQNGKTNAVIQHANVVNINIQSNEKPNRKIMFGNEKISVNDATLLKKFKKDYKSILMYCISIDPTGEAFDTSCIDMIETNYNEKWQFDWRNFESEKIRNIVYHTLNNLNEYLHYLSDEYMRPLFSQPGFMIFRNQSPEEGEKLCEELRPNSLRIRKELSDRYLELWPVEKAVSKQSTENQ